MVIFGIGCAVNRMLNEIGGGIAINTDKEELECCKVERKLLLSPARRWVGPLVEDVECEGPVVILAGLGGGTGTVAVPEVARIAREKGCHVTVIVTLPFPFEGPYRRNIAAQALAKIQADRLIPVQMVDPPRSTMMRVVWAMGVTAAVEEFRGLGSDPAGQ
jgi:cell division GTPase FtsZ